MWQKCPICNGTGTVPTPSYSSSTTQICKICNSKGIISQLTGSPSSGIETFASPKYRNSDGKPTTDFRDNCEQFEDK